MPARCRNGQAGGNSSGRRRQDGADGGGADTQSWRRDENTISQGSGDIQPVDGRRKRECWPACQSHANNRKRSDRRRGWRLRQRQRMTARRWLPPTLSEWPRQTRRAWNGSLRYSTPTPKATSSGVSQNYLNGTSLSGRLSTSLSKPKKASG